MSLTEGGSTLAQLGDMKSRFAWWRSVLRVVALCIGAAAPIGAQVGLGSERKDAEHLAEDIWAIWRAPAHTRQRDLVTVAATLGAAAVTSRIDSSLYAWMQTHEKTFVMQLLSPIREKARIPAYELGSGQFLLPVSGVLYLAGRLGNSPGLRDAGIGCASGHLSSVGLRQLTFHLVQRARPSQTPHPFEFGVPGSSEWERQSFYSGHISNSMSCASFLTHRFSLGAGEPLLYLYSTMIGLGRLADGHHWASDMVLGGVIGFAIGREIAHRQLGRRDDDLARVGAPVPILQWSVDF